jgi:virulence-associated protein VapD
MVSRFGRGITKDTNNNMSKTVYAIAFDLDTKAMKEDALTESQVTAIYNQAKRFFGDHELTIHTQCSMYATEPREDALKVIFKVIAALKELKPEFTNYLSRCDVVHIDDSINIMDMLTEEEDEELAA